MKTWLTKFEISNALSERKPLPPSVEQAMSRNEEARRFAENSSALAGALKNQLPRPAASAARHDSIMRAVGAAGRAPAAENRAGWPRWIAVSSIVLLVLMGVAVGIRFIPHQGSAAGGGEVDAPTLAAAGSALELGGSLMRGASAAALSPLSEEMERLERDWARTEEFLLASLP